MKDFKNISVRLGSSNPNGTGQWLNIGRLYTKDDGSNFITLETLALSPSLIAQLEKVERTTACGVFSADKPAAAKTANNPVKGWGNMTHWDNDDIPF